MFASYLIKFSYFVSHQQTIWLNSTNQSPYLYNILRVQVLFILIDFSLTVKAATEAS